MRVLLKFALTFSVAVGSAVACGGGGGGGGGPSTTIAKSAAPNGDAQTATVATVLTDSIRVLVQEDGLPKVGATVAWTTTSGGSLSPTSSTTDAAGLAASRWTLGQTSGAQTARATLSGASGSPLTFNATGSPGAPTAFTKSAGDAQTGPTNAAFDDLLSVKVADQFGNGISGVTVDWAVQSGPVTLSGGATSVTSSSGLATKSVVGGAVTGPAVVRASTAAVAATNLDFNLTVALPPVRVSAGLTFFRSVKNATQDPAIDTAAIGQPVRWTVNGGGNHTVRSQDFTGSGPLTAGDTYTITFPAAGTYQYDCQVHGGLMTGRVVVLP